MAKGTGPGRAPVVPSFWGLPADWQEKAEADACKEYGVEDFFDLPAAVRTEVRARAVEEYDRWWSGK